jgi:hypothetical protein
MDDSESAVNEEAVQASSGQMPKIPTIKEQDEAIRELLETVHYVGPDPNPTPLDKYGLPYVQPEPDDPDDEPRERAEPRS